MKLKSGSAFWIYSVFFTLLNRFSLIGFGVLSYIILAKKVFPTVEIMGVWALFQVTLSIAETIKQGLLRNPLIKFLSFPQYAGDRNRVQSASLYIHILYTLLASAMFWPGGVLLARWLNTPGLLPLFPYAALYMVVLIPFNHFEILLQAHFRFKAIFYGYFARQGIFLLAIIVLLLADKSRLTLINLAVLQILALICGTGILWFFARRFFYHSFQTDRKTVLDMLHFGKYIFGTNVFSAMGRSADQFITAGLIAADVVAYYNIVSRINNMMDVPSVAAADVLFPKNVEAFARSGEEKVGYYFERMVGTIISIILPASIVIFLLPRLCIEILAGPKYFEAIPILQIVILFSFLRPFSYQFGSAMDAIGKPKINFIVNGTFTLLNYGLMYLGLRYTGWMGAAYGAVVTAVIMFAIIYIILQRTLGIRLREVFRWVWESYRLAFRYIRNLLAGGKISP